MWRSIHGADALWGLPEQLLALIADHLAVANWQRAGGKRNTQPKQIPRPGVKSNTQRLGDRSYTPEEFDAIIARNAERHA